MNLFSVQSDSLAHYEPRIRQLHYSYTCSRQNSFQACHRNTKMIIMIMYYSHQQDWQAQWIYPQITTSHVVVKNRFTNDYLYCGIHKAILYGDRSVALLTSERGRLLTTLVRGRCWRCTGNILHRTALLE